MNKFFLRLLGYKYVTDAKNKRNVHTLDCSYADRILTKRFLTKNEFTREFKAKTLDGCVRCMPELSRNKVGRPKKVRVEIRKATSSEKLIPEQKETVL